MAKSRYYILGEVGQGQFGKVYCASDRQTGELVALKSLDHRRFTTQQFLREIAVLVRLRHPNIVSFHALEYNHTGRYIVMDYCQGGTLRQLMDAKRSPTLVQKLTIVRDVLRGLEHAHRHHVIHCDLKPENILLNVVSQGWTSHIADFGISQFQEHPQIPSKSAGHTGSPAYMAPERFYGEYSPESDLYSIGVLLFELMMDKRPFSGMPMDVMKSHLNQPLRIPIWVPTLLKGILQKSLQKLPQHRYGSAQEMSLALETAITALEHAETQTSSSRAIQSQSMDSGNPTLTAYSSLEGAAGYRKQKDSSEILKQVQLGMEQLQPCLALKSLITTPIHKIWIRPQGCFIATENSQGWTFSLLPEDGPLQVLGLLPKLPEQCSGEKTLQPTCLDLDPQGRWLAIARSVLVPSVDLSQLEVYRLSGYKLSGYKLSGFKPISQALIQEPIQHLWWSSSQHLLLETTGIADQPQSNPQLQLWNRRGQFYWSYPLPSSLQTAVISATTSDSLFAIASNPTPLTLNIQLRPFKVQQISLGIEATWIGAFPWGYVLLTPTSTLICLNRRGKPLLELSLPDSLNGTVSAIATQTPATLWIATAEKSGGMLYTLDLSPHLPKSMGRITP